MENYTQQRRLAEQLASKLLERQRVSAGDVLKVFRLWAFKKNISRPNVTPEGSSFVHSDTFGLQNLRNGLHSLTSVTQDYPHVMRFINKYFEDNAPPGFGYTSISVNHAYAAKRHRDKHNEGPSMTTSLGSFAQGGGLRYWADDDGSVKDVRDLPESEHVLLNTKGQFKIFDGSRAHEVQYFSGERISFVFFTAERWLQACAGDTEISKQLKALRFPVPDRKMMIMMKAGLPAPVGYGTGVRCSRREIEQKAMIPMRASSTKSVRWDRVLWPFQRDCLAKIESSRDAKAGLVSMNCGTGKSLVELATIFKAREPVHMLVVPTLELAWQFVRTNFLDKEPYGVGSAAFGRVAESYDLFAFCSYNGRKLDSELSRIAVMVAASDAHIENVFRAMTQRCTFSTDHQKCRRFLNAPHTRRILLVTYCSFDVVKKIVKEERTEVGEMIFDEAHHVAGRLKRESVLHDWPENLPRRKLFFTATPVRSGTGNLRFNMFEDCGAAVCSYNYARALQDKVCCPIAIQLFSCGDAEPADSQERRLWIYRNISRKCFLDKQVQSWNILTYHRYATSGEEADGTATHFVDEGLFQAVFQQVQRQEFPCEQTRFRDVHGVLDVQVFALTMLTKRANTILARFEDSPGPNGRIRLIASCTLINEGINTKSANMLVPVSPSYSLVRSTQRLGRIQRNSRWGFQASPSLLLLPVEAPRLDAGLHSWDKSEILKQTLLRSIGPGMFRSMLVTQFYTECAAKGRTVTSDMEQFLHDVQDGEDIYCSKGKKLKVHHDNDGSGGGSSDNMSCSSVGECELICKGVVPFLACSSGDSSLDIVYHDFDDTYEKLKKARVDNEFATRWLQWQKNNFRFLSPTQQDALEQLEAWGSIDADKTQGNMRKRISPNCLYSHLQAYAQNPGLDRLFAPPSEWPGGEKEKLLRQWCRRLRLDHAHTSDRRKRTSNVKKTVLPSRRRLTQEFIAKLEALPGWRWRLRPPRGRYPKRKKQRKKLVRLRVNLD